MKVSCEIKTYPTVYGELESNSPKMLINSVYADSHKVDIIVEGKTYRVEADELVSAIGRAKLNALDK